MINTIQFTLPAYWASALINGDFSGVTENDIAAMNKFAARENIKLESCLSCSDESWFSWHNDSGNGLGGDVMEFTFAV